MVPTTGKLSTSSVPVVGHRFGGNGRTGHPGSDIAPSCLRYLTTFAGLLLGLVVVACDIPAEPSPTAVPTPEIQATISAEVATQVAAVLNAPISTATRTGPTGSPAPSGTTPARVLRVVDGDTIEVDLGGASYRVRYIGVDTPETVHPSRPVGCFGPEASAFNKALVRGQTVYLETDLSDTDRYGRLLRYVWLGDGRMVNQLLVEEGYAQVTTYPPDVKYVDRFLAAQQRARDEGRGLWGACGSGAGGTVTDSAVGGCDTAYPTVCIPPPPPDLNCGDIPFKRFAVLPSDPHRIDGDKDGVGCEG